jgi:hypothetical protein
MQNIYLAPGEHTGGLIIMIMGPLGVLYLSINYAHY